MDRRGRVQADPVELLHRFTSADDLEVVGLLVSSFAYGRADVFKPKLATLVGALGPSPAACVDALRPAALPAELRNFSYRFHGPGDLLALLLGVRAVRRTHGSLGAAFAAACATHGALEPALATFAAALRAEGRAALPAAAPPPRALEHLLPDAAAGSSCKRLLLYLRWMVRRDDVDVGAWEALLPRRALLVPIDVHLLRVSRRLGLTRRKEASLRTSREVTDALARIDPADPVRFDFPLCHLGMSGTCPATRRPQNCAGCPLRPACPAGRR